MAKITRKLLKVFASNAVNNGVFGSAQAGTKVLSSNIDTLQGLPAWLNGWLDATISAQKLPTLEEMQAIDYVITTQLSYLFQEGIPEYLGTQTYYENSIVKKAGTYELYGSKIDDNLGNALPIQVDDANWQYLGDLAQLVNIGGALVLPDGYIFVGDGDDEAAPVQMNGEATMDNTGDVTLSNSAVIGKVLTGFSASAGVVAATDTILQAFNKIVGNIIAGAVATNQDTEATYSTITANIPYDDSIPQSGEGTEILSLSYTPKNAANKLVVEWDIFGALSGVNAILAAALFKDAGANALNTSFTAQTTNGIPLSLHGSFQEAAGSTSARTYKINVGANSGNFYVNGNASNRLYGGTSICRLRVTEYPA